MATAVSEFSVQFFSYEITAYL